jgi:hypothetical protein
VPDVDEDEPPAEDEPPGEDELPGEVELPDEELLDRVPEELPLDPPDVVPELELPDEPVLVVPDVWAEPGSVAAMAPVASTLATPTPAVTTDSRLIPRRLSTDGGSDRPPGSLDIAGSLRRNPVLTAPITDNAAASGRQPLASF